MAKTQTPIEAFLAPLARHARKLPHLEGLVFWGGAEGWDTSPSEALEAEEIAFYAEGLLEDGFRMRWTLMASADAPGASAAACFSHHAPENGNRHRQNSITKRSILSPP